ncbi:MAG: four helix bundle protein [Candidatus Cloacimonadales bacterium]|nr:four helix bundle protein [Candidatus Cloacimonadales bacterium]
MDSDDLKKRTKQFALQIIKLVETLPKTNTGRVIGYQLVKAGTSVGANYRAACRGRSKAEFNSKLHIVLEEADESAFWLELIVEAKLMTNADIKPILDEANELVAIFSKSYSTAKRNI